MPLPTEFAQKLPQRSDKELYEALAHAEDYLPEALERFHKTCSFTEVGDAGRVRE